MKKHTLKSLMLATGVTLTLLTSACAGTDVNYDKSSRSSRYYNMDKETKNADVVKHEKPVEKSTFYGGSFYAVVKNVSVGEQQFTNETGIPQTVPLYKLQLEGERGTIVNITTEKPAQIGQTVLFHYSNETGQIYHQNEPEFQHYAPQGLKRNPK